METRFKDIRRPIVSKVAEKKTKGVNFIPKEFPEKEYQDLKRLKKAEYIPELSHPTDQQGSSDAILKTVATHVYDLTGDDLEEDFAGFPAMPVPVLAIHDTERPVFDTTGLVPQFQPETGHGGLKEKNVLLPVFSFLKTDEENKKTALVPELPLEDEVDLLENLKKSEFQTAGVSALGEIIDVTCTSQPESEDSFVSVQTKKVANWKQQTTPIPSVLCQDWDNFQQQELRQTAPVDHFIPNTVQYTTKPALKEFVQNLLELPSGTHGCIVEEGYTPDGNQYCENIHFVKEKLLGSGSFGKVDLMVDSTSRKKLVRKQVEKSQMRIAEVIIPLNLDSRHVTKIIGLIQRETGDYCGSPTVELLLEYAGTALNVYLLKEVQTLTNESIWLLTKQALEGLAHIHTYGMIHLDIKPENLCVKEVDNNLQLKITDFGSAKLPYDAITFSGWTPEYMAPESCQYFLQTMHDVPFGLAEDDITGKVDVFALFLVIGYMYGKKHVLLSLVTNGNGSYYGLAPEVKKQLQTQLIVMMAYNRDNVDALIDDRCDLDMRELLKRMSYPMKKRASAREALEMVERREQNQLQLQRAKDLKLQMIQQQIRKREKLAEFQYTAPEMNQQSLPATVLPEMNSGRSLIKDRLREKLLPYKKLPKQEAPKTPQTPVEEMQMLQIRLGTSRKISVDKRGGPYTHNLEMVQEESSFPMTETGYRSTETTTRPSAERAMPVPGITAVADTSLLPTPTLPVAQPFSPRATVEYEGFIDIQTQDNPDLQGNIPNFVFDML